ncbi:MAG: ferritin family protein [Deltaproteobacteria bacterium]|nr:ferritin family protein [Deltaproteobacteria bacterium]MBW2171763.1 ferritin family protein [Deltaproteobacteria bacterium]
MGKEPFLNALKVALTNEMRERDFYLKNAERTKNPLGRAMFQQIADEELEHFQKLKELHEKWQAEGKWPETVPVELKGSLVKDVLKDALRKIDQVVQTDEDELKAIRKAMDFEAKGVSYYTRLRDEATDTKVKSFFDLLAAIEHEHYLSLKETEKYLSDPASWIAS